jgi:hypothetical protein
MQRLVIAAALAMAVSLIPSEPSLGAARSGARGPAYLERFICRRAFDPGQREVSVTAVMRPLPGTIRMRMRFELLRSQSGTSSFVRGGDLGIWISPQPLTLGERPADIWIVNHPVSGLPVPADYRFRVTFRWTGQGGRTIGRAVRLSERCRQLDLGKLTGP